MDEFWTGESSGKQRGSSTGILASGKLSVLDTESSALSIRNVMCAENGSQLTQRAEDERAAGETRTLNRVLMGA